MPPTPTLTAQVRLDGAAGTRAFAASLAGVLRPGDLLILTGELGAGKTTFTQGLGEGLGVPGGVISPTFVLSRIHPTPGDGPDLVHVDAYRLRSGGELTDLDIEATADRSVTVVEWGRGLAESLAGFPEDPQASWLDIELVRALGGAEPEASHDAGPASEAGIVTDFSDEEGEGDQEVRTAVVTGYGPRWAGVRLP
ncbi:MAG: tRNA (adenosine(37)-N6)-threonylcarbamoyltransferase complex ATPase subunit type 1 TsaE [Micrococcus sp.]|nr:tRNA (adenosine(37)-N6)-threonylcarbamoyltransferase complex ATPase subunit type 1 TsaE [Micrococcus sp.]MDY6055831.1 tRNA (adenosine(37)-N6)-threonylcarbamoyltransferase complex ATPase subunit type 1 TsaE [Micrococcus sp.]